MALDLNPITLQAVAEQACRDAAQHGRWLVAIGRALVELDSNPWIERGELHGLVIGSPSGNVYSANGVCQCQAYKYGRPCWHRAAARLVRLHDEREAAQQAEQCPSCCASVDYADRCPAVQISADQELQITRKIAAARATAQLNELFA